MSISHYFDSLLIAQSIIMYFYSYYLKTSSNLMQLYQENNYIIKIFQGHIFYGKMLLFKKIKNI